MPPKGSQITVRLDAELEERAAALQAKLGPLTTRVDILREAMRLGFDVLEEQYRKVPDYNPNPVPRRPKR